jgi:hypothetical protein
MIPRATAWGLLLVLLVGYLRLFVVCDGPHCASAVEFVHSSSICCEAEHEEHAVVSLRDHSSIELASREHAGCGEAAGEHLEHLGSDAPGAAPLLCFDHEGCSDAALSAGIGPLPKSIRFDPACEKLSAELLPSFLLLLHSEESSGIYGSKLEPPRREQISKLLATTILRV